MFKLCTALVCSLLSGAAIAGASSTVVTFSKGTEGWEGPGYDIGGSFISSTPGNKYGPAYYSVVPEVWGLTWANRSNSAFVETVRRARSLSIGLDLKVNSILYKGREVSRNLIVEFRDYDNTWNGEPYTSVWYKLGPIRAKGNWRRLDVRIADTRAHDLPRGWGGNGSGMSTLPPGRSFGDVLANADEIVFSTFVPGEFYDMTDFDLVVDNITISADGKR